jgi:hypothetical protein
MPTYILTLLKNPESYLEEYFTWDIHQALVDAISSNPSITNHRPRYRNVTSQAID